MRSTLSFKWEITNSDERYIYTLNRLRIVFGRNQCQYDGKPDRSHGGLRKQGRSACLPSAVDAWRYRHERHELVQRFTGDAVRTDNPQRRKCGLDWERDLSSGVEALCLSSLDIHVSRRWL